MNQANTVAQFECLQESIEDAQDHNTTTPPRHCESSRNFLKIKVSPKTMLACIGS